MTKTIFSIYAVLLFFISANASDKTYNIADYGAKKSLTELNTQAIQKAIDAAYDDGGGTVIIPKGTYVTGTLFLKSNVTIKMEAKAKLYGSANIKDYAEVPLATEEPRFTKCLFYANQQENITIIGHPQSEINGRGYLRKHEHERPKFFRIEKCKNIRFEKAIIKNSGSWCVYFKECDSIFINKCHVYNKENKNNDGIDLDGCSNVWITECNLQVEDDAICLKSSVNKICENIYISDCTVSSYWACVKFGTASKSGFKNVQVKNCQFFNSLHGCIKLLAVDGAILEDVLFENIQIFNSAGPIFIRLGNRGRDYSESIRQIQTTDAKPEGRPVGKIRNITFRNIEARLTGNIEPPTECMMFTGIPGYYIENVTMENIHFSYTGFGNLNTTDLIIPEHEAVYPEQLKFGLLPSYGMYLRHIKGLNLKNVTLELRNHDNRPAIVMDDIKDSSFENLSVDISPEAGSLILMSDSKDIKLNNIKTRGEVEYLLEVKGTESKNIKLLNTNGKKAVNFSNGANKKAVKINN